MKLLITNDSNKIFTDNTELTLSSFTEYGNKFSNIETFELPHSEDDSNEEYDKLVLFPVTHITNVWHLMPHMFILYKYLKTNNISCDVLFFIFFKGFYERQGNITECIYKDLIFEGLGFDYNKFRCIYDTFKLQKYIKINQVYHVNENINFKNEPLFCEFKQTILNNFKLKYTESCNKKITFVLRKGTREITNIDFVKEALQAYDISYVYLENHNIKEQLSIIANTDILIGVHGAGLTWCIFMKNKSTLIEMYPGNSNTDNYSQWCRIANINYKRLCINITAGEVRHFRSATVNINEQQIQEIQSYLQ